ncbi:MAG: GNAT family N-acetyltransferase [Bacteroidota bacterium]|nr:GNAT family N-acetyltransferase [Bacteroidota bacterium]
MIRIESFKVKERPELAEIAFAIRREVFVVEQFVDPVLEYDEYEDTAIHYLLFLDEVPLATARWRETGKGIKLERFATLKEYRNKGIGNKILDKVMEDVLSLKKPIYLHSQVNAISFYERNGFVKEGEMFIEAEIKHYLMTFKSNIRYPEPVPSVVEGS